MRALTLAAMISLAVCRGFVFCDLRVTALVLMVIYPLRLLLLFHAARHVPTCRTPPGEGGGSKCKERGISHPGSEADRAKGCTSGARKPGETPCAREGQSP